MASRYTEAELLQLDPQLDALFKKRGLPKLPLPTRDNIHLVRKGFAAAIQRFNTSPFAQAALPTEPDWTERDHEVPVSGGRTVSVRVYTPRTAERQRHPVLLFAHAGGWCMGGSDTEAFLCRLFCSKLGLLVVDVAYGLYPEVAFDVPQQECFDVGRWVVQNADSLGGDLKAGFVWGGNSGGCTWMAVAAHRWRRESNLPPITGSFLLCPIFTDEYVDGSGATRWKYDRTTQYKSMQQCERAPLMSREMQESIAALNTYDFSSELLSPFRFSDHQGLGATYVAVSGIDPWRDGGVLYADELRSDGIPVKLDMYPGLLHCWWSTFPHIEATKLWLDQSVAGMRWVLDTGSSRTHVGSKL